MAQPRRATHRQQILAWVRRHPWRTVLLGLLTCAVLLNVSAYQQARALLTYSPGSIRTPPPQSLSFGQKLRFLAFGPTIPRPKNTRSPSDLGLASETFRISTDDGVRLEGWLLAPPQPKGTVLLFHGYAGCRSGLLEQARAIHDLGFATLLVDFRGSGGSDGNTTTLGCNEAQDVVATVRHVRALQLPRPLILYGQSMGGAAILRSIAVLGVQPDGIILESVFDRLLTAVANRFALMGVPSFPVARLLVFWGGVQAGFSGFDHNPAEFARACTCPALVMHGAEDRHSSPEEGRAIYESLDGRKAMVVFPGAGHTSLYDSDPDQWRSAVSQFLAEQVESVSHTTK